MPGQSGPSNLPTMPLLVFPAARRHRVSGPLRGLLGADEPQTPPEGSANTNRLLPSSTRSPGLRLSRLCGATPRTQKATSSSTGVIGGLARPAGYLICVSKEPLAELLGIAVRWARWRSCLSGILSPPVWFYRTGFKRRPETIGFDAVLDGALRDTGRCSDGGPVMPMGCAGPADALVMLQGAGAGRQ